MICTLSVGGPWAILPNPISSTPIPVSPVPLTSSRLRSPPPLPVSPAAEVPPSTPANTATAQTIFPNLSPTTIGSPPPAILLKPLALPVRSVPTVFQATITACLHPNCTISTTLAWFCFQCNYCGLQRCATCATHDAATECLSKKYSIAVNSVRRFYITLFHQNIPNEILLPLSQRLYLPISQDLCYLHDMMIFPVLSAQMSWLRTNVV